jgi:hypothetical protein
MIVTTFWGYWAALVLRKGRNSRHVRYNLGFNWICWYAFLHPECNWKVRTLGTSSKDQKRKNEHINKCPGIFNLWVIAERILLWPIQLSFILAVLCEMFLITPRKLTPVWVKVDPLRRLQLARFESSGFLPVATPKIPCVCSCCCQ